MGKHQDVKITRDSNGDFQFDTTRSDGSKGTIRTVDQTKK